MRWESHEVEEEIELAVVQDSSGGEWVENDRGDRLVLPIGELLKCKPTTIEVDGSITYKIFTLTATLTGRYTQGSPGCGPSYASGGEPPDPPEWDTLTFEVYVSDNKLSDKFTDVLYPIVSEDMIERAVCA